MSGGRVTIENLLNPDREDALDVAGAVLHFMGESRRRLEEFARWTEHHPGDLDADMVLAVLGAVHDKLVPGCRYPLGDPLPSGEEK